jgi:hypothetical protein
MFFWVWRRMDWLIEANVLKKRTISIFRAEVPEEHHRHRRENFKSQC